jgi:predicted AlkP superfamily phosphohydrolase/phosphomutase
MPSEVCGDGGLAQGSFGRLAGGFQWRGNDMGMKKYQCMILLLVLMFVLYPTLGLSQPKAQRLYWFIPDGMRADPEQFNIYRWAKEGELPNIRKLMEEGAYGFSIPDFPSHTPINFASLLTGAHPRIHGIADGPMHVEGAPLARPSASGFSSTAKKVAPVWNIMERIQKSIVLLSIPGSTPPEIREITIRGRWGGWGADTHNMIFESERKLAERKSFGREFRLFFLGSPLTSFVKTRAPQGWGKLPSSYSVPREADLEAHGLAIHAMVYDSSDDGKDNFDRVVISLDKQTFVADLKEGEWSSWIPVTLKFKDVQFPSQFKVKAIKLWESGDFRIRVLYNNLNRLITKPPEIAGELTGALGPMVDFADNWPPQLIFEKEDKDAFMDEMRMSLDWHRRAVSVIYEKYRPDVFIQDTYTPNQMLESRWWHGQIDPSGKNYSPETANLAWKDIMELYKGLDAIIGEAIKNADKETLIVLSSDHGICALHRIVRLNNFFAKKGWLTFSIDKETGEPSIDWKNTKVIYLKMAHIYINPKGLDGDWRRASGVEYDRLRQEVIEALQGLEDRNGAKPVVRAVKWEDAEELFNLPTDRIGDVVLETRLNYFWYEEVDSNLEIFTDPLTSGYKQTINPETNTCIWTPFLVWGPGVKRGYELRDPVHHVDQLPTILKLMDIKAPDHIQGRVLSEVLQ